MEARSNGTDAKLAVAISAKLKESSCGWTKSATHTIAELRHGIRAAATRLCARNGEGPHEPRPIYEPQIWRDSLRSRLERMKLGADDSSSSADHRTGASEFRRSA